MMTKKELEQHLAKLEDYLPNTTAKKSKRPGRPKKYDDRLVLFLIALREKYGWSLRDLEKKAKEIVPKGIEVPDFSSIHYRIRNMKEYVEEMKPKLLKVIPDIAEDKAEEKKSKPVKAGKGKKQGRI